MNRTFTLLTTILFLFPCYSFGQTVGPSVTNIAGGSAASGYYRFDWSVGEMCVIETYSQPNVKLTNGFLQPGIQYTGPAPNIDFFATGDIIIFPNPAATIAEVNFKVSQAGQVTMRLTDAQGKLLHTRQFDYNGTGHIEKLDVQQYAAGGYFITIQLKPADQSPARKGIFKLVHVSQ
jgi:hypothetical protein